MSITYRIATLQDKKVLLEMGEAMYLAEREFEPLLSFSPEEAEERYTKELVQQHAFFVIAEEEAVPVGYAYAHVDAVEYLSSDRLECEIEVVFVSPQFRSQGVATQLIEQCLSWAKTQNVFRVKAGIFVSNIASQATFAKSGFLPYHTTYTLDVSKS